MSTHNKRKSNKSRAMASRDHRRSRSNRVFTDKLSRRVMHNVVAAEGGVVDEIRTAQQQRADIRVKAGNSHAARRALARIRGR